MVPPKKKPKGSFLVQVLNEQNATWQGTLSWIEKNRSVPFRSTLELIKLIDGALESNSDNSEEADQSEENDEKITSLCSSR